MRDSRRKGTTKNFDQVVGISYLLQLRITQPRTYFRITSRQNGFFSMCGFPFILSGLHCIKMLATFPSPDRMPLTKLSLAGNNLIIPAQREFGK
jgi:hypothetical protein